MLAAGLFVERKCLWYAEEQAEEPDSLQRSNYGHH